MKLCGFRISNYHNKVRLALLEKGIACEEDADCRPSQKEEFLSRSPLGKVPFLDLDGVPLCESQVIMEYLEDAYPGRPLLPKEPLARARVRELVTLMELHLELPARRLYRAAFFGGTVSEETKEEVRRDLDKGVRGLRARAKFSPYIAGGELSFADCAAFVHLPLVTLTSKICYGRDVLAELDALKPYLRMLSERPAFERVNEDRKVAQAAAAARAKA